MREIRTCQARAVRHRISSKPSEMACISFSEAKRWKLTKQAPGKTSHIHHHDARRRARWRMGWGERKKETIARRKKANHAAIHFAWRASWCTRSCSEWPTAEIAVGFETTSCRRLALPLAAKGLSPFVVKLSPSCLKDQQPYVAPHRAGGGIGAGVGVRDLSFDRHPSWDVQPGHLPSSECLYPSPVCLAEVFDVASNECGEPNRG